MAVLSLPLSFTNSFWSQDYRKGLEVLYKKLEQGTVENDEILAFIRARADAEGNVAAALTHTAGTGSGFTADDGATLLMAFRGLQAETARQGEAHKAIAHELHTLVADPFQEWARGHRERLEASKSTMIDGFIRSYEHSQGDVIKLKNQYLSKVRKADEADDDAKFAPGAELSDKYTTSPRLAPRDRAAPARGASISERIAQRLKDIQRKTATATAAPQNELDSLVEQTEPKLDKGKGRAVEEPVLSVSPPPLSPPLPPAKLEIPKSSSPMPPEPPSPILLAGLSLPPSAISDLLSRAASELRLRPVRFPILGEYHCFTGEEFVVWLSENVEGLGGSFDRAEDAARDLTERDGLLRRIGELGNSFEPSDEAYYQFRQKAFELGRTPAPGQLLEPPMSPTKLAPVADNLIKRSNNFLNVVSKALSTNPNGEPPHVRARLEADAADRNYRIAVRKLDRQRLALEERIEEALKIMQKWEADRLRAVKTVLLQYHGTLSNLPKALEPSLERSNSHIAAYLPESDLSALIERYRTGPFRPHPQVYESVSHDESDVLFGIDLRRWADGGWNALHTGEEKKELVPPVLTALLEGLTESYAKLPNDEEKRKAWIYEVPLPAIHHLRESLNAVHGDDPIPSDLVKKYDTPVIASTVKLWMLELDPPLALWEGWDDLRRIYPNVGSAVKAEQDPNSEHQHIEALQAALQRLPKVHLYVLDAVVKHLRMLIDETKAQESDEVYTAKLALSVGRTILRPKFETGVSVQDRHPAMFFIDLIKYYSDILPPTIAKKKNETERKVPLRKRTAPVDMRMSRSRLSVGADAREWLAVQRASGNVPPPVPPIPSAAAPAAVPPPPPVPAPVAKPEAIQPAEEHTPSPVVAPTPIPAYVPPPPPLTESDVPTRPRFKSPPPETDDLPPRPTKFKEPDLDDVSPPPRPSFATPPPESEEGPASSPAAAAVVVSPPTPARRNSGSVSGRGSRSSSPAARIRSPVQPASPSPLSGKVDSRSTSPAVNEDQPINPGRASLSRTGSNAPRSPRGGRPPRTGGGGSVSAMVSNFNRNSVHGTSSPRAASPPQSAGGGYRGRRPQSGIVDEKRKSLTTLSRRTMESDAEDAVVG
ncbi:hypothetical protein BV25DRAFT_1890544 [Artomyces pyxidatus]|uniref:Uncharacterized protein n=1 Tax=Artomyces pyxidatus TaxID=48021 RepID=A0ACB8SR68_9AGAM|nr:hypothetical protein BV25DRAFT_1890544 [Artomyces pyxidatus]